MSTLVAHHKVKHLVEDMRVISLVRQPVMPEKLVDSWQQLVTTRQLLRLSLLQYASMLLVHTLVWGSTKFFLWFTVW